MILAVITYVAAIHMIWPSAWFAYAAGLTFWYLIMKTLTYFFMTQLDLRQWDCVAWRLPLSVVEIAAD